VIEPLSNPPNWEDYVKKSTTHENGTYNIEDEVVVGDDYERNISVKKDGYIPIKKKITIIHGNRTIEQNFILTPQKTSASGFNISVTAFAIMIIFMIARIRRE
jgi:hypothetical protein